MAALSIPEQHQLGLAKILALPDDVVDRLIAALENVAPSSRSVDIIQGVALTAPDLLPEDDMRSVVSTLYSLYNLRAVVDVPLTRFLKDLMSGLKGSGNPTLQSIDTEALETRLRRLTTIPSLELSAKAFSLQREHEHLFHDAQIFTDLRPVFKKDVSEDPVGMVLAYTLKVIFHDGTRHKEVYFALDADDVTRLKQVVERAEAKSDTLKRLLEAKEIRRMA